MLVTDIVVLTEDNALRGELENAASSLGEQQPRWRFVSDHHALHEVLRSRPEALVLVPFGDVPGEVGELARELSSFVPPVPVVAIFRPNTFGEAVSESAVLIDAMRSGVRDFLRRPISTTELRTLLDNLEDLPARETGSVPAAFGRVISFISNKGGVGKSTLAVNTAVALALKHPGRVLLIDGSLQMGVAAALLDVRPESTLSDVAAERARLDETMVRQLATQTPHGLHLLAAPADAVEAMEVDDTFMSRVITLGRRAYDYVVVDTFPMFDRVIVATLDLSDRAYVVVENVVPTLLGAVRLLDVLQRIGFPAERQKLIVNRWQRIAGSLRLDEIEARMQRPIDHVFPYDKLVMEAANSGQPIAAKSFSRTWSFGFGGFARPLANLVAEMEGIDRRGDAASSSSSGAGAAAETQTGSGTANRSLES